MGDGGEIEAAFALVAQVGGGHRLLGAREHLLRNWKLINRARHLVLNWRHRAQVSDDAVEVAGGENFVETARHDRRKVVTRGGRALQQGDPDLGVAPVADAGCTIGRDVGCDDVERGLVEAQSAGQRLVELRAVRSLRGVAVVAGHDGVHEIAPALERCLRARRRRRRKHGEEPENHPSMHALPSLVPRFSHQKRAALRRCPHDACPFFPIRPAPALRPPTPPSLAPVRSPAPSPRRRDRQTQSPRRARSLRSGSPP